MAYIVNGFTAQLMNKVKKTGRPLLPAVTTRAKSILTIIGYIIKNRQTAIGIETTGAPSMRNVILSSAFAASGAILPSTMPPTIHSSTQTVRYRSKMLDIFLSCEVCVDFLMVSP